MSAYTEHAPRKRVTIEPIGPEHLLTEAQALRGEGWRLVQILGISSETEIELSYSFGLLHEMRVLRFSVAPGFPLPSITPAFPGAYLYENELRDLFGVTIECISIDWLGRVFDVAETTPFSKVRIELPSSEEARS